MKLIALIAVLLSCGVASAQEHAPLEAQCQADVKLWAGASIQSDYANGLENADKGLKDTSEINRLAFFELYLRSREMAQCKHVDPKNFRDYRDAFEFYEGVMDWRRRRFFERHPELLNQMMEEDKQGER